jgi:hypothetical protein
MREITCTRDIPHFGTQGTWCFRASAQPCTITPPCTLSSCGLTILSWHAVVNDTRYAAVTLLVTNSLHTQLVSGIMGSPISRQSCRLSLAILVEVPPAKCPSAELLHIHQHQHRHHKVPQIFIINRNARIQTIAICLMPALETLPKTMYKHLKRSMKISDKSRVLKTMQGCGDSVGERTFCH